MNAGKEFLETSIRRMKYYKQLGNQTIEQLTEKDLHYTPNEATNSIAMVVQHMHGNMLSRWTNFLTEDGEKEWRQRDDEFEPHDYSKEKVLDLWEKGWACFLDALAALKEDDLLTTVYIRKEALSATDAIIRQLAHYPYHVGQIVHIGKIIKGNDWKSLSIPKGNSQVYNNSTDIKDPAKKFS